MTKTDLNRRHVLALGASVTGAAAMTGTAKADGHGHDLSGQSVLITGASSGFGRLMAESLARQGAKVFATMRNVPRPEAKELEALATSDDLDITVIEIDVTKPREIKRGVAKALDKAGGKIDVLVNNAGIAYGGPVELQDEKAMQTIFDTNVFGPQRLTREVLPSMREAGSGLIVNVSSQLGRVIIPGFALYSPTKFALEAMSEQMAYETAGFGIEVTIIQPGGYPTEIWENAQALTDDLLERTPEELRDTYAAYLSQIEGRNGGSTDPMDVPNAVAEVMAMPAGSRPLRRPVHPGSRPQEGINQVSAQTQKAILERSGLKAVADAVLD
ncbi:MAG: SDR family oxidoreductase [Parvularculaceae bacterium]|nr:SDR family oxidoreductase [Parvularculaceae bacterium]